MPKLKIGDLVYLRNVGFPFDGRGTGGWESIEGMSCVVVKLKSGSNKEYIELQPLLPVTSTIQSLDPANVLFPASNVVLEDRPWLKNHIKNLLGVRLAAAHLREALNVILPDEK